MTRLRARVGAVRRKMEGEAGQGLAEYALILALIAVVCVAGLSQLGLAVADTAGFVALPTAL